jgi:hypothetical protein
LPESISDTPRCGVRFEGMNVVAVDRLEAVARLEVRFKHDPHLNVKEHGILAETLTEPLVPVTGSGYVFSDKP